MQHKLQKIKINFLVFLELQLLISLVICPILIAWGLPISTMSIVGNLIFAQFLTVFIFLSAIFFSCSMLGLPTNLIAQALEIVTNIWHYFLSFGSAGWLIGFPTWLFPISLGLAIIGCSLYYRKTLHQNYRIAYLAILFCIIPALHQLFQTSYQQTIVLQGNQKMHLIKFNNKIFAFDCGALGARPSSQSWIDFTLMPALIKNMGTTAINTLVLCKSNSRTNLAAKNLIKSIPTEHCIKIEAKK